MSDQYQPHDTHDGHDGPNGTAATEIREEPIRKRPKLEQLQSWISSPKREQERPMRLVIKNHFIAMIGEYTGTVLFLIFALGGTNVALIPNTSVTGDTTIGQSGSTASTVNTSNLLYIALSFGFSLAVNAWIFFRVSGGLFNPAVSLGMVLVGSITPVRGVLLSFSQILGGITGAAIIQAITPGTLNVRTTLGGGTSVAQGLFIEMFLTALLMLAILLLAAEKHKATFIAPIGIGLALFIAELLGVYYTGGSLNPARSFGPSVVLKTFEHYHWIYWLGPAMGAVIAAGFFRMLKFLQYETVLGPDADAGGPAPTVVIVTGRDDEEKKIGIPLAGKNVAVSGPDLDQLLRQVSNPISAAHMERSRSRGKDDVEDRLARIEAMLRRITSPPASPRSALKERFDINPGGHYAVTGDGRLSDATMVNSAASGSNETGVAGQPHAELGRRM